MTFLVQFLDGLDATSPEMGKFCRSDIPPPFISSSNAIRVEFHTDVSASGQGFLFNWEATTDMMPTTGPTTPSTTPGNKKTLDAKHWYCRQNMVYTITLNCMHLVWTFLYLLIVISKVN